MGLIGGVYAAGVAVTVDVVVNVASGEAVEVPTQYPDP